MSIVSQSVAEYPPHVSEMGMKFTPPGPVTRVLVNYLAMCQPRRAPHHP
jgi:hypothetical protein